MSPVGRSLSNSTLAARLAGARRTVAAALLLGGLPILGCGSPANDVAGPSHSVRVFLAGPGSGTVTSDPAAISCPPDCGPYAWSENGSVTLHAEPASGSFFAGWSVASCPGTGDCQLLVTGQMVVTATFRLIER